MTLNDEEVDDGYKKLKPLNKRSVLLREELVNFDLDWYSIVGLILLGANIIRSALRGFSKKFWG
jgi:hypothetical protein